MFKFDRYPGGKHFAVTFSYDDGNVADRILAAIFNKYGLKATFHLISGRFDHDTVVSANEVRELYSGHEVSCHTYTHPHLERMPMSAQFDEIFRDRARLEELSGGLVRGMSYPYGTYDDNTLAAMKTAGIVYSRTTASTKGLSLPADFLRWNPTCHHSEALPIINNFKENTMKQSWNFGGCLYVWGHSFEFDRADNWELAESICSAISGLDDVWYATNIEIYDYITAQKSLIFSADGKTVFNPSVTDVWVTYDGSALRLGAGESVCVK